MLIWGGCDATIETENGETSLHSEKNTLETSGEDVKIHSK